MKSLLKYTSGLALAGLLSFALISPAQAQRGFHGGWGRVSIGGGGFHSGIGFRSGIGFGFGGFGRYAYPAFGLRIGFLPYGYYPFYFGSVNYYYYGGTFYRPYDGGGYEVAVPPVGATVPDLPRGASSIKIDGQQYYEFNGVYYEETLNDKGKKLYVIVGKDGVLNTNGQDADGAAAEPKVGDIVNQLPDNCRKVELNGKKYFVAPDGIYYEEFKDKSNGKGYRIVSIPMDGEQQN
jgi:hypothetical protein